MTQLEAIAVKVDKVLEVASKSKSEGDHSQNLIRSLAISQAEHSAMLHRAITDVKEGKTCVEVRYEGMPNYLLCVACAQNPVDCISRHCPAKHMICFACVSASRQGKLGYCPKCSIKTR